MLRRKTAVWVHAVLLIFLIPSLCFGSLQQELSEIQVSGSEAQQEAEVREVEAGQNVGKFEVEAEQRTEIHKMEKRASAEDEVGEETAVDRDGEDVNAFDASSMIQQKRIAAGVAHTLAVDGDGVVWSWGRNIYGELGNGTTGNTHIPQRVLNLEGVAAVSAGIYHSVALREDGTVWTWGQNSSGQLGDGTKVNRAEPVQAQGLDQVVSVLAASSGVTALKADGTVWTWGRNNWGQVGDGTNIDRNLPQQVEGLEDIVMITGYDHFMALKCDGTVWAWGKNDYGQVGNGTKNNCYTPVQVDGLENIVYVGSGAEHSFAVDGDSQVFAWGNNGAYQLGDGTTAGRALPQTVAGYEDAAVICGGRYHTLSLKGNGTIRTNGRNSQGQLGDGTGTTSIRTRPFQVAGLENVVEIDARFDNSIAVDADGQVYTWGYNAYQQLGVDGSTAYSSVPLPVFQIEPVGDKEIPVRLAFEKELYNEVIPAEGTVQLQVKAAAYDDAGIEVDAAVVYSLDDTYEGLAVDEASGILTISSDAAAGEYRVTAKSGSLLTETRVLLAMSGTNPPGGGSGTEEDPYILDSPDDLTILGEEPDGYFKLADDIDLEEGDWEPVELFSGVLDGDGYEIKNLEILTTGKDNGLFRRLNGAEVRNLTIIQPDILATYSTGALASYAANSTIENCSIKGGSISGNGSVGGLIGEAYDCVIRNVSVTADVEGRYSVGGLVGYATGTTVENIRVSGNVSQVHGVSGTEVGGIIGLRVGGSMERVCMLGNVTGTLDAGGLVGFDLSGDGWIKDCFVLGDVSGREPGGLIGTAFSAGKITNCYFAGTIYDDLGRFDNILPVGSISCYYDAELNPDAGASQQVNGRTTSQMKQSSNYAGWDFSEVWLIDENQSYPNLRSLVNFD